MIVIKDNVYVRGPKGYVKCVLHRKDARGQPVYFLVETKVIIPELPIEYQNMTLSEVIAKYGNSAVVDYGTEVKEG